MWLYREPLKMSDLDCTNRPTQEFLKEAGEGRGFSTFSVFLVFKFGGNYFEI